MRASLHPLALGLVLLLSACGGDGKGGGRTPGTTCDLACGSHGTCVLDDGVPRCDCDEGFTGEACDACAPGRVGPDCTPCPDGTGFHDGVCVARCSAGALECGPGGQCVDSDEGPVCACAAGYEGATCASCAPGFQDHDGDGVCAPACTAGRCAQGSCDDTDGTARCLCDEGWAGDDCSQCAPGWLVQADGSCAPSCALGRLDCGPNGVCEDADGVAACSCDEGWAGDDCSGCAQGWQDNDGDGVCRPGCGTAALTCPAHAACDDGAGVAACVCAVGYLPGEGGCVWAGGPVDGSFREQGTWQVQGAARIEVTGEGDGDPGRAYFPPEAFCGPTSSVRQVVPMPPVDLAQPLALRWRQRREERRPISMPRGIRPRIGGALLPAELVSSTDWSEAQVCLGERAFGGTIEFALEAGFSCLDNVAASIDQVRIEPDDSCPMPGAFANGDFAAGAAGWTTGGNTEIRTGDGPTGGATLEARTRCSSASLATAFSPPRRDRVPGQALRIRYAAGSGGRAHVTLGDLPVGTIEGGGGVGHLCLPPFDDYVARLRFAVRGAGGACDGQNAHDSNWVQIRQIEWVEDPACVPDGHLLDGGFESSRADHPGIPGWRFEAGPATTVRRVVDPARARSGNGALQMTIPNNCNTAEVSVAYLVPQSDEVGGPALRFWYKADAHGQFQASGGQLAAATEWTEVLHCLPASEAGNARSITFRLWTGSSCAGTDPFTAWLDDVEAITHPECPVATPGQGQRGLGPGGGSTTLPPIDEIPLDFP